MKKKMKDPYKVLGLKKGASQEEIREAYKKLVKKYHPDQYANNPLSDLAEEKLEEINKAYNYLMIEGSGQGARGFNNNYQHYGHSQFIQVRDLINRNQLQEAEGPGQDWPAGCRVAFPEGDYLYAQGLV